MCSCGYAGCAMICMFWASKFCQFDALVSSLSTLQTPSRHVCEGCILRKMQRASLPKDGSLWVVGKL